MTELLDTSKQFENAMFHEGFLIKDKHFDNRMLLVESSQNYYSFNNNDILSKIEIGQNRYRISIRNGVVGYFTSSIIIGNNKKRMPFKIGMESIAPRSIFLQ